MPASSDAWVGHRRQPGWCIEWFRERTWLAMVPSCGGWRGDTLAERATGLGVLLVCQHAPERPEHTLLREWVGDRLCVANV
jgi:hypothetical protein